MIQDVLNQQILSELMAGKTFESAEQLRDGLKTGIVEALMIDGKRAKDIEAFGGLFAFTIHDELTTLESEVLIAFKAAELSESDIKSLHEQANKLGVIYGVLISPAKSLYFQYKRAGGDVVIERLKNLPPLNHVDYEFGRDITPIKIRHYVIHRKWIFIAAILFILLMIASALAQASICKTNGVVKGDITEDGVKVYYLPTSSGYDNVVIGDVDGERRFCDERTAIKKGWVKKK